MSITVGMSYVSLSALSLPSTVKDDGKSTLFAQVVASEESINLTVNEV
jgi:hypothetical protein